MKINLITLTRKNSTTLIVFINYVIDTIRLLDSFIKKKEKK